MTWQVRPFAEHDYPRFTEVRNAVFPQVAESEGELRHRDAVWDHGRYFMRRLVADGPDGRLVGWCTISHMPDQFHADRYGLTLGVDPSSRRQGAGAALYDAVREILAERGAQAVRADAQESEPDGLRFLERRGFVEMQRAWESRLAVAAFDETRFSGAADRAASQGIRFTTLAAERERGRDVLPALYELYLVCNRDVPEIDPVTDVPYDYFLKEEVDGPDNLLDAYFLAADGDRFVGMSNLYSSEHDPGVVHQGLTGVIPAYRGKGIAMALKLLTVEYARRHGKREIRTWNNTRNRPMLRINEAMGFAKQPVWVVFQKELGAAPEDAGAGPSPSPTTEVTTLNV